MNEMDDAIGGEGTVVEIDECLIAKRKYNRGRPLRGEMWVLGGVQRGTRLHFMEIVPDRTIATLIPILARKIKPGTLVISDCFRTYHNLPVKMAEYGVEITHGSVNHSENFVDPATGHHTQTIEGTWSTIKRFLRRKGTHRGAGRNLLKEASYKKLISSSPFEIFVRHCEILTDIMIEIDEIDGEEESEE